MYRRRRHVVAGWVVLLVALVAFNSAAGGEFLDEFQLPGSESQEAFDRLAAHGFGSRAGFAGQVVFKADQGIDGPAVEQAMQRLFDELEADIPDAEVVGPYAAEGGRQVSRRDPTIAYAEDNLGDRNSKQLLQAGATAKQDQGGTARQSS